MFKIESVLNKIKTAPTQSWITVLLKDASFQINETFNRDFSKITNRHSTNPDLIEWFKSESNNHNINVDWNEYPSTQLIVKYLEINSKKTGSSYDLIRVCYIPGYDHALVLEYMDDYVAGKGKLIQSVDDFDNVVSSILEKNTSLLIEYSI